jgi:hypothetical protein
MDGISLFYEFKDIVALGSEHSSLIQQVDDVAAHMHLEGNRSRVLPDRDSDCRLTKQVRRYIGAGQFGNHESPYAG